MAPASPFSLERYHAGLAILRRIGVPVHEPATLFAEERYLAGPDATRRNALLSALRKGPATLVLAARGGYGCTRLLPLLPRTISGYGTLCGFSDVTALLYWFARAGGDAVHGPVVTQLPDLDSDSLHAFERFVRGGELPVIHGMTLRGGHAEGRVIGGNLSLICALLATPFAPDFRDVILFLEDVGEPAYRIDRMLTQLRQHGVFERVRGVLLGEFTGTEPALLAALQQELTETLRVPLLTGAPIGHGARNLPLMHGAHARLSCTERGGTLQFEGNQ